MKSKNNLRTFLLIFGIIVAFATFSITGCSDKVEITQTYTLMEPVYLTTAELRASFEITVPQPVHNTGKIYLYQNYIFLNEPGEGIHIIDNSDREHPEIISFIKIPGNYEMAARGNRIFADSYLDLVVIDITNPTDVKLTKRIENIFLELAQQNQYFDPEHGIIVDWEPKEVVEVSEGQFDGIYPSYYYYGKGIAFRGAFSSMDMAMSSFAPESSAPMVQTGVGGSMARFTIMKDHLYSIDNSNMMVFDISNLDNPVPGAKLNIGWGIETIFPYKDNLFIGSQTGMIIYDNSNPDFPTHLSTFSHIMSCDPVVVENDIAYVTLRGGTGCRNNFTNQLDVIDVSNLKNPVLLKTYPMTNPHGLGIDNGVLFICEGTAGLKVFDASDIYQISSHLLAYYGDIHAYDVIPFNNNLIMIGESGLYQFDYSDKENIKFISMIPITRETAL
jgi:hypothetical protein